MWLKIAENNDTRCKGNFLCNIMMLHDDYLCLVESGKQQIKEVRGRLNRKTWKQTSMDSSYA